MQPQKVKSGIAGLDGMLDGGFVKNSVVAVAGETGSGRTIFISQFLYKGAVEHDEPGLFISFDEQKASIYSNLASFGWDLMELEREHKMVFIEYPHNEIRSFVEQEGAIRDLIQTLGIKRVAIDSITSYALMFSSPEERQVNTLKFINAVKNWKTTCLISSEVMPSSSSGVPHTVSGVESFADGLVHLAFVKEGGKRTRAVEIVKMRGSKHNHEALPAYITDKGFMVGSIQTKDKKNDKLALKDWIAKRKDMQRKAKKAIGGEE